MTWNQEQMAKEVLELLDPHSVVNLGIGLPTLVAQYALPEKGIIIHSENGILGVGPRPEKNQVSPTLINAGKETISSTPGASYFDSALSFGMIRGGHVDSSILGGMQVDVLGNLANWWVPGKKMAGMGGAMDLVHGSRQVIIMMSHFDKEGLSKLVHLCNFPLTGQRVVDKVVTDHGVFAPNGEHFVPLKWAGEALRDPLFSVAI